MARRLVWMGGGLLAVGVLLHLSGAFASGRVEQTPAAESRASSTPARVSSPDPVANIEASLRGQLLKDNVLKAPPASAPLAQLKAYDYAVEAKEAGADDLLAVRAAAERVWNDIQTERKARTEARKLDSKQDAQLRQEMKREKIAKRRAEAQPAFPRELLPGERPPKPDFGPNFFEDPEKPLKPAPKSP